MNHNNIEIAVLVKGRPITEYKYRGQTFVEGRADSNYEIEIRNNSHNKVEAVLSVDGLSVIDGKAAGPQSSGYVIEPRSSVRVPGWTLNNQSIAAFAFSGKQESYATQVSSGDARNNGVIGVMVFAEKYKPLHHYVAPQHYVPQHYAASAGGGKSWGPREHYSSPGVNSTIMNRSYFDSNMTYNCASASLDAVHPKRMATQTSNSILDAAYNPHDGDFFAHETMLVQSLGTAFGEAQNFATTTVTFTRGDMVAMVVLYYDEARGLKARGIEMSRPSKKKYQTQPDAFPGMQTPGCQPPKGWRG